MKKLLLSGGISTRQRNALRAAALAAMTVLPLAAAAQTAAPGLAKSAVATGNIQKNGHCFFHSHEAHTFISEDAGDFTPPDSDNIDVETPHGDTIDCFNTALGLEALDNNTTGAYNTAYGNYALANTTTGGNNIGIGNNAGYYLSTGDYNIDIGNLGVRGESGTTRIGDVQTRAFIAGIRGVTTGVPDGVAVVVDRNGQLGTLNSSRRYKENIADMNGASSALLKLRPVTFHYKVDQNPAARALQYGLIAEEVAEVYPGLVARSADGQIETVLYQFLPTMLLNELQKQRRTIEAQAAKIGVLEALAAKVDLLESELSAVKVKLGLN